MGNRPAALPGWLCVGAGPMDGMPGRDPAGSGEVTVIGGAGGGNGPSGGPADVGCAVAEVVGAEVFGAEVFGAVMATAADALAALGSAVAVPVTVRLTDLTAEAVSGTVSWTWSCRCADSGSTAPKSQDDVPSDLPQPKLNLGVPLVAGLACSLTVAAATVKPVVQAFTVQRTCLPRSLLACAAVTSTQRVACVVLGVGVGDVVGDVDGAGAGVVDFAAGEVAVDVAVCVAAGVEDIGREVVGGGGVVAVEVGVGVVEGDVVVGMGDGLGDAAGSCSGSHDCLPVGASGPAAAVAAAAKLTPETAVNRALPAITATAAGRGCANRMKTPADAARYCSERLTRLRQSLPGWLGSSRHEARA